MPQNRLNLNFKLALRSERLDYVRTYLNSIRFEPNEYELEMIAKYILWGKESETDRDGAARLKKDGFQLESSHTDWTTQTESLDELLESPLFNEATLSRPVTKKVREVFSRTSTRKKAPANLLPVFESLWREIDSTELLLTLYDINHKKRSTPPRPALISQFSPEDLKTISNNATSLTQFKYLKLRHELVELRQQQYNLKDIYSQNVFVQTQPEPLQFEYETINDIAPLNYLSTAPLFKKIFTTSSMPVPSSFNEDELALLSKILWSAPSKPQFDFQNVDHLYGLYQVIKELEEAIKLAPLPIESNLKEFLSVARSYESLANLDAPLQMILKMKENKKTNQEISEALKHNFNKSYHPNYISTLYCKKCLGSIAQAARNHREVLENLFFPENFKKCKDCGGVFLLNEVNFVKRSRSHDGFSPRCKRCEKIKRDKKNQPKPVILNSMAPEASNLKNPSI